ncbi:winged helix-turn-helix domain-containing protein [uncultured Piscinibacter sp.]|uniref:winged helix-turn-helix domain-containing tetratricopeptide repeat protein n=1 Tax=uncultured Piscinibacter sp. TaxID=1131835 RepID=UPI00262E9760|nr:winged helix-turn-helix domain-containing protein [uncultured Piscinibacter sp.]
MRYRFSGFTLDTALFELSRDGQPVRAEPQVIELLALLVEHRGRMVDKDEINQKVWRGRVVSDAALSSRIKTARQLLGDDGQAQRLIRTVHKRGFRFVGEVSPLEGPAPEADGRQAEPVAASAQGRAAAAEVPEHFDRPAIAVLPFVNLSGQPEQEYFSDGVTTDIITRLSKHRWLDVLARNTSFGFRGKAIDVREFKALLDVDYVVEGSVQRGGDRVRINVQLVDTRTGHTRWSERYERELSDIFALQDDITETIVARLEPEIGFAERHRVVQARHADLQAWECYHLGTHHLFKFTGPDNLAAQRLLRRSQELDPLLGEAYAWWAYAVVLGMVYWDTSPSTSALDDALAACTRALSLDPQNATFHAMRARVHLARCEYDLAIADNETAIHLNPTFAAAHCGMGDSLAYEMRYDEAIERFRKAIDLSPNDPQLWAFLSYGALALIFKGDFATALQWADRASGIPNCQYWTTAHRIVALAGLDRLPQARSAAAQLMAGMPEFTCAFVRDKLFYVKDAGQVERYIDGLRVAGVPPN